VHDIWAQPRDFIRNQGDGPRKTQEGCSALTIADLVNMDSASIPN
jgi:hypothetical protein